MLDVHLKAAEEQKRECMGGVLSCPESFPAYKPDSWSEL